MGEKLRGKEIGKDLVLLLAGTVIYSIGMYCFVGPAKIAPGGAIGIALMINHLTGLPIGRMTMALNLPLFVWAWFGLSKRFAIRTAITCAISSFVIDDIAARFLPAYLGDQLMGSLYGGILAGVGMAFIFLAGCTTGGTDIVGYLLQKKMPHISIGRALMMIDGVILAASVIVFGNLDAALFGLISLYAQTKVIDMIIYGSDAGSQASVITKHPQQIADRVIQELNRTVTILPAKGGYSGAERSVVLCIVRKSEFSRLKRMIAEIDENAFVIVSETSSVFGLGFKKVSEQ